MSLIKDTSPAASLEDMNMETNLYSPCDMAIDPVPFHLLRRSLSGPSECRLCKTTNVAGSAIQ